MILVATPVRKGTPEGLVKNADEVFRRLTYPELDRVVYFNQYPPARAKYANNARARNELIAQHLRAEHTHVLWLDVDVVETPHDLVQRLLKVSSKHVVAPMVLFESRPGYTGRFYDIGGFVQSGRQASYWPPYFEGGKLCEMDSVGTCYLIPTQVYRNVPAPWYETKDNEVEHPSLMAKARAMGMRVLAARDVVVFHAYLPDHGESLR